MRSNQLTVPQAHPWLRTRPRAVSLRGDADCVQLNMRSSLCRDADHQQACDGFQMWMPRRLLPRWRCLHQKERALLKGFFWFPSSVVAASLHWSSYRSWKSPADDSDHHLTLTAPLWNSSGGTAGPICRVNELQVTLDRFAQFFVARMFQLETDVIKSGEKEWICFIFKTEEEKIWNSSHLGSFNQFSLNFKSINSIIVTLLCCSVCFNH